MPLVAWDSSWLPGNGPDVTLANAAESLAFRDLGWSGVISSIDSTWAIVKPDPRRRGSGPW
jgi:hypothetical protein